MANRGVAPTLGRRGRGFSVRRGVSNKGRDRIGGVATRGRDGDAL